MIRYFIILNILLSCSFGSVTPRNVGEYSTSPKIVKYYLPELPSWANISSSGNCKRSIPNKYLNFSSLRDDFSFNYNDLVQFQYLFNIEYQKLIKQADRGIIPFAEEEQLFYDVFDKIKTRLFAFRRPTYKRVNLVWIDNIRKKNLLELMSSNSMNNGHPVFVSLCLNQNELVEFIEKSGYSGKDIRALSFEIFSPFNKRLESSGKISLDFSGLFTRKQKLYFYTPKGILPPEFIGKFRVRRF